jgi:hypothetical protein
MEEDSQQLKLGCNGALTLTILPRLNNWNLTVGTMNPNAILGRTILPISDAFLPKYQRPAVSRREVPVGGVWSQEAALESWRHEEGFGFKHFTPFLGIPSVTSFVRGMVFEY